MKKYPRFITLVGGLFAFFCFALPWKHDHSGAMLANGKGCSITIAFVISLALLSTGLYMLRRKTTGNSRNILIALGLTAIGLLSSILALSEVVNTALNFMTISFLASITIIGISIYMLYKPIPKESVLPRVLIISSVIGICCFLILFFSGGFFLNLHNRIDNTHYGAFLTTIGYILVIVNLLYFSSDHDISENSNVPENEMAHNGDEG